MINRSDTLSNSNMNDSTVRSAIAEIRVAQEKFYKQEYSEALKHIDNSLSMYETAENLALKGSILYMMSRQKEAGEYWERALAINPDMPGIKNMMRLIEKEEPAH
jgi:predicted negative regulator of RcsB-dependent stress response